MVVRASMSGADARKASALRGEVRERLVTVVQTRYPNAFPRPRTAVTTTPETGAPGTEGPETVTGATKTDESHS